MWHNENKLKHASIIAGFEAQDDAEEAVLGLRMIGFRDTKIGYFFADGEGQMKDQLACYHRFAGSVVGTAAGAVIGWAFARLVFAGGQDLDPVGLAMISAVTGAFFFGMLGGMMGLWLRSPREEALVSSNFSEPYVVTVNAGDTRDAWSIIRQHGGHELRSQEYIVPCQPGDLVQG
jgi:hypothetical protein